MRSWWVWGSWCRALSQAAALLESSHDPVGARVIQDRMKQELMALPMEEAVPIVVRKHTRVGISSYIPSPCLTRPDAKDRSAVPLTAARLWPLPQPELHRRATAQVRARRGLTRHAARPSSHPGPQMSQPALTRHTTCSCTLARGRKVERGLKEGFVCLLAVQAEEEPRGGPQDNEVVRGLLCKPHR